MRCPRCTTADTRVIDSRAAEEGAAIRRRRECLACGERFTTFERPAVSLLVIKRSGERQPFQREKIRRGLEAALTDRPVPEGSVEAIVRRVETAASRAPEVASDDLGRAVLDELRDLDEVAYVRFASVYKDFQGIGDFEREVAAFERDS